MEHTHTHGPWRVFNHRSPLGETGDYENVVYVRSDKQTVCYCNEIGEDEEEVSNANLIACAPEMLDLLVETHEFLDTTEYNPQLNELVSKIKDLIQKATGV